MDGKPKVPIAINPETETRVTKKENASDRLARLVPLSQLLLKAVKAKAKMGNKDNETREF